VANDPMIFTNRTKIRDFFATDFYANGAELMEIYSNQRTAGNRRSLMP